MKKFNGILFKLFFIFIAGILYYVLFDNLLINNTLSGYLSFLKYFFAKYWWFFAIYIAAELFYNFLFVKE